MMEGIKSKRGKKGQSETNGPRRALLYNYFAFEQEAEAQSDEGQRKQMLLDRADFLTAGHNKNFSCVHRMCQNMFISHLKMPIGMYPIADADVMCTKMRRIGII